MISKIIGRYGINIDLSGAYLSYVDAEDAPGTMRVVKINDITDVIARRREHAPVREFRSLDGVTLADAAETGDIVSRWELVGVVLDSLFGDGDDGLYLVGDDKVCIASYDLEIAQTWVPGDVIDRGIDGLLLPSPKSESGCGCHSVAPRSPAA